MCPRGIGGCIGAGGEPMGWLPRGAFARVLRALLHSAGDPAVRVRLWTGKKKILAKKMLVTRRLDWEGEPAEPGVAVAQFHHVRVGLERCQVEPKLRTQPWAFGIGPSPARQEPRPPRIADLFQPV